MSQRCPRCGLFSPAEAVRCDCGYDFASDTVGSLYLRDHQLQNQGGATIIEATSRTKIWTGVVHVIAALQLLMGVALLSIAGWFYVLGRTTPHSHFIPGLLGIVAAPPGVGLIGSGLALKFRCPGWQVLQLAPWFALVLTIAWLRSLP